MLMFSGILASRGEKACVRHFLWRLLRTPSLKTISQWSLQGSMF